MSHSNKRDIDRNVRQNVNHDMNRNRGARWLWLSFGVLAADRATKFAIERYTTVFFRRPIVSDIVVLVHNRNPGIAFGVFSDSTSRLLAPVLVGSAIVLIALLAWLLVSGRMGGTLAQTGLALILGGAAGNALDRVIHHGVTDFLEVRLWTYIWPAFNVADSAITIGAILVFFELLFADRQRSAASE
jgi:signal peptidase II